MSSKVNIALSPATLMSRAVARVQPGGVNVEQDVAGVAQRRKHGILDAGVDPGPADRGGPLRLGAQPVDGDRDVMRHQIPGGVGVGADRSQVGPDHRDVVDATELPRVDVVPDPLHRLIEDKDVTDQQDPAQLVGERRQLVGLDGAPAARAVRRPDPPPS